MLQVNVQNVNVLAESAKGLLVCNDNINSRCKERIFQLEQLYNETENEEKTSCMLLETARSIEATALAVLLAAQARLATAVAAEASAIASGNPVAIAAATAEVAQASHEVNMATEPYELAVKHRELMEKRYEMALQSVSLSKALLEQIRLQFKFSLITIYDLSFQGSSRLQSAYSDILKYLNEHQPQQFRYLKTTSAKNNLYKSKIENKAIEVQDNEEEFEKWDKHEPCEKKPVYPPELIARLNCSIAIMKGLLSYLCNTDEKFRRNVYSYRYEFINEKNRNAIEVKIKKNMVGRLGEEIVLHALKPYGETALTQNRYTTEDGSYTKTDLIIDKLKVPIILGCGNGAREGESFAIEVKCGSSKYILSQEKHLVFQAEGHKECAISCVICSRDIKDIPKTAQSNFRDTLRNTGSPILGMLPKKSELDKVCFDFVFGE